MDLRIKIFAMKSRLSRRLLIFSLMLMAMSIHAAGTAPKDTASNELRKNAIYYEIFGNGLGSGSLNYDRIIPFNPRTGLVLRAGISWFENFFPLGEVNILSGNQRHNFEGGVGYTAFPEGSGVFLRTGYRFHGKRGMLIRAAPMYLINRKFFWYGLSLGYSF